MESTTSEASEKRKESLRKGMSSQQCIDEMLVGYNLLEQKDISMMLILKSKDVVFAFIACGVGMYNVSFFTVFLSLHLEKNFHVAPDDMGYYFALLSFPYFFSAILAPAIFA